MSHSKFLIDFHKPWYSTTHHDPIRITIFTYSTLCRHHHLSMTILTTLLPTLPPSLLLSLLPPSSPSYHFFYCHLVILINTVPEPFTTIFLPIPSTQPLWSPPIAHHHVTLAATTLPPLPLLPPPFHTHYHHNLLRPPYCRHPHPWPLPKIGL